MMASLLKPAFNVVVNTSAAYLLSRQLTQDNPNEVGTIVAIDTVFRIAITHLLTAMKLPCDGVGQLGNLIFLCSTIGTQPLSVALYQRIFKGLQVQNQPMYLSMMAYIFFGWKVNLMVKDVICLCFPSMLSHVKIKN
jgi:hypothetical protein